MKSLKSNFLQSVAILFTGTVLAQIISLLATPFISRLYTPEENAYFGLFLKVATIIATLITARLEFAFTTVKQEQHAFALYKIAFRLAFFFSFLLAFIALGLIFFLENQSLDETCFILSIPVGVLFIAWFNLGNNWSLRMGSFGKISQANVLLSIIGNLGKIIGGFFYANSFTLIGTTILAYLVSSISFLEKFFSLNKKYQIRTNSKKSKYLLRQNRDFYTFNLFHVLLDLARETMISIYMLWAFSKFDFGSFDFASRMLKLPVMLIAATMSQVYFKKAQDMIHQGKNIRDFSMKTLLSGILISLLIYAVVFFFGEYLFTLVFGEKWAEAGKFSVLITPWIFMHFICTPLSYIPILFSKQKVFFWINAVFVFLLILLLTCSFYCEFNITQMIHGISFYYCVYFCTLLIWFWQLTSKYSRTFA